MCVWCFTPQNLAAQRVTCIGPRGFCDDLQVALKLRCQDLLTGRSRGAGDATEIPLLLFSQRLLGSHRSNVFVLRHLESRQTQTD